MKENLKVFLVGLLVMGLLTSFMACSKDKADKNEDNTGEDAQVITEADNKADEETKDNSNDKKIRVGFAIKTQDSPYFVALVGGVKDIGKEYGWDVSVLDANGDITKEAENIETFISQKLDLIFLDSVEPDACIPSINKAADAGIPVINLDSGVGEGSKDVTTVYSDNKQNGRMVGLAYAKKMGDESIKAILLSGAKGNVAGKERRTGLFCGIIEVRANISEAEAWEAALKLDDDILSKGKAKNEAANFEVAGQGWGGWTEEEGLKVSEDLITANNDLNCILGENDQMLFGAMTALKNANLSNVDIVAAADGAKEAYDRIKEGTYFGTGENSPYKVSKKGMEIAKEILEEGKAWSDFPKITLTDPAGVTKDNVDEYYDFGF